MNSLTDTQMQALSELVAKMKSGSAQNIQVGGNPPVLLTTFFQQVLNSLSKDILPHDDKIEVLKNLKQTYPNFTPDPKWDVSDAIKNALDTTVKINDEELHKWADRPNEFRRLIQKHITALPPQYQLDELNRIQKSCPFTLVDPSGLGKSGGAKGKGKGKRKVSGVILSPKKMHYGYADLYKFLGFPFSDTPIRNSAQGQNPFYQPLELPVPDVYANNVLSHIKRFSPSQKLMEAQEIFNDITKKSGGGKEAFLLKADVLDESYYKKIERMAELAHDVANRVYSPVTLSHFVPGQERPMKTYLENDNFKNFNEMLLQLQNVHIIKPINDAPNITNYRITESALKQVKGKSKK